MRLLLTNDDGIFAPGLEALRDALAETAYELNIIAPDRERSATGHSITMHRPIRVRETCLDIAECYAWVVDGTPADCVKLGLESLLKHKPDLVISGINLGPNVGTDVIYSGTVSAAMEGLINRVPSIAVSLASHDQPDFRHAAAFIKDLVPFLIKHPDKLASQTLLNINIPPGKPAGFRITRMGDLRYKNAVTRRLDPRGKEYYWMAGKVITKDGNDPDTDIGAIQDNFISISPLKIDLTDYDMMEKLIGLPAELQRTEPHL